MYIRLGTRKSMLAVWQAEYIASKLQSLVPDSTIQLIKVDTRGDRILDKPLAKIGGKGLFTQEIESLLQSHEIDIAVHSLKDVPITMADEFELVAFSEREDRRDCFLSDKFVSIESLPKTAIVGTTSLRRTMQLKYLRPDLKTQSLRGNVGTRLQRLKEGKFDAIILAYAGIKRLGIDDVKYIHPLETDYFVPAVGQGVIAIECKKHHQQRDMFASLNNHNAAIEITSERSFLHRLGGGCQSPIGVCARLCDGYCRINAIVGLMDGSKVIHDFLQAEIRDIADAYRLGVRLAEHMIDKGALDILAQSKEMDFEGL